MAFPVLHSAPLLLLRLSSLFLLLASQYCSGYLFYQSCVSGNYTNESPFHENLLSLLSSLSSRAPANDGYFNDTIGQAPDLVYGLALCRGDVVEAPCRECLANAANQVATVLCPNKKNATVWYETCLLRYSDRSFFGIDEGGKYTDSSYPNVTGAANYGAVLGGLLRGLRERAVRSPRLFAAGKENVTSFREIYGLVQCTRDITPDVCHSCLTYMFQYTNTCCANLQEARQMGASCFLRFQANRFYNASGDAADSLPLPPVSLPATTPGATGRALKIALSVTLPLITLAAVLITTCTCLHTRKKVRRILNGRMEEEIGSMESLFIDLQTLKIATDNFSDLNKLGQGGFGIVYKGVLPIGQQIAVKRLSSNSEQGLGELRNEVGLVAKLQHRNLVRLLGCCLGDGEKLLVYEYLPNKSLDRFLFDPSRSKQLNWERRVKIIEGIARGLQYLHEDSRLKVIHRDLKASNILLDDEMNPKISDFGLAKLFGNEQSQGNVSRLAGTYGYMAPEYVMHGQISTKSDVYSFGILVLEIVTGRKCIGAHGSLGADLLSHVWRHWDEGNGLRVVDRNIAGGYATPEVLRCIHLGILCAQQHPDERPNMSTVVLMLSSYSVTLPIIRPLASYLSETTDSDEESTIVNPQSSDVHPSQETEDSCRRVSVVSDITVLEPR